MYVTMCYKLWVQSRFNSAGMVTNGTIRRRKKNDFQVQHEEIIYPSIHFISLQLIRYLIKYIVTDPIVVLPALDCG